MSEDEDDNQGNIHNLHTRRAPLLVLLVTASRHQSHENGYNESHTPRRRSRSAPTGGPGAEERIEDIRRQREAAERRAVLAIKPAEPPLHVGDEDGARASHASRGVLA